jgi:hypothetical protein
MNIEEAVNLRFTVIGNGRYKRTKEHDSLVLDTYKNTFYWNSRGFGGDVATFLTKILNVSYKTASLYAEPAKDYELKKADINPKLVDLFWTFGKNNRDFWYERGFNDEVIDLYKLGFFGDTYTLPFIMFDKVKAIILRGKNKFISEIAGSTKSLFGLDNVESKNILLVESPLDVPLLKRFGYDAISYTYGANAWDNSWDSILQDYNVTVIPDNDSAGKFILNKITFYCKVVQWPRQTPKRFDVGKLYLNNEDKFKSNLDFLIENAVPVNFLWHANAV